MSELSTVVLSNPVPATPRAPAAESAPRLAKEFVRWCFSFGADFRNAPDVVNLRTWARKTKLRLKSSEENEVLVETRKLYLKRIEQMVKKAEAPLLETSGNEDKI